MHCQDCGDCMQQWQVVSKNELATTKTLTQRLNYAFSGVQGDACNDDNHVAAMANVASASATRRQCGVAQHSAIFTHMQLA